MSNSDTAVLNFNVISSEGLDQLFLYKAGTGDDISPVDLTNFSFKMQIRDGGPRGNLLLQLDSSGNGITIDPNQVDNKGQYRIVITSDQIKNILVISEQDDGGSFEYDLVLINIGGEGLVLFKGVIKIRLGITEL